MSRGYEQYCYNNNLYSSAFNNTHYRPQTYESPQRIGSRMTSSVEFLEGPALHKSHDFLRREGPALHKSDDFLIREAALHKSDDLLIREGPALYKSDDFFIRQPLNIASEVTSPRFGSEARRASDRSFSPRDQGGVGQPTRPLNGADYFQSQAQIRENSLQATQNSNTFFRNFPKTNLEELHTF